MKIGERHGIERFWDQVWAFGSLLIIAVIVLAAWRIFEILLDFSG